MWQAALIVKLHRMMLQADILSNAWYDMARSIFFRPYAGAGLRQERLGWFITIFRGKWSASAHAVLLELFFLPGLQACFASLVGRCRWATG